MNTPLVTVVIPTIKPRKMFLRRAVNSIIAQDMSNYGKPVIEICADRNREGAAETRNRGLLKVQTPWVAFLDDDDYFLPHHLATLLDVARDEQADVVYPGCRVVGPDMEEIPLQEEWGRFGREFDPDLLRQKSYIPVTSLVRTELAQASRFGRPDGYDSHHDDWGFYLRALNNGGTFLHVPKVTWVWHHHGRNTSGLGERW